MPLTRAQIDAAPRYQLVVTTLNAGEERLIPFVTDFLALINATNKDEVAAKFDATGTASQVLEGLVLESLGVPGFWLKNTDTVANTITVAIGSGRLTDNRQLNGLVAQDINLKEIGAAAFAQGQRAVSQSLSIVLASGYTLPIEIYNGGKKTYTVAIDGAAPTSANYVLAAIEAGAGIGFRLRRLIISIPGSQTAADRQRFEIVRTTAASAAGVATTPQPREAADGAFTGIAKITNPTITAGVQVFAFSLVKPTAVTTAPGFTPFAVSFDEHNTKPIIVPAGVANGIAMREINGAAGAANFCATLEITEE